MVTCLPQNLKIAFIDESPPRNIAVYGDAKRAAGFCWRNGKSGPNCVLEFTLWPLSVICSNHRNYMDAKHPSVATGNFFFWHHNCQLLIRSQSKPGPELIRKICRSDYETGRWEALKLKPAQMESDACSANRRRPTAGCLKASDLWQLEGYGNCCLTGSKHTLLPARANRWIHTQVLDSSD